VKLKKRAHRAVTLPRPQAPGKAHRGQELCSLEQERSAKKGKEVALLSAMFIQRDYLGFKIFATLVLVPLKVKTISM
jgi:hypothetical protein